MASVDEVREAIGDLIVEQARLAKGVGLIPPEAAQAIATLAGSLYELETTTVDE